MNAIALKPIIQEGIESRPGYCEDPLLPLWESGVDPDDEVANYLVRIAQEIDQSGSECDWIGDLQHHIQTIKQDTFAWYAIALRVWKIKLFSAYKSQYKSFQQFCENALGCSSSSMNNKIRAARVVSQLISWGFERLPKTPGICTELVKLPIESLFDTWRDILTKFSDHQITAEKVRGIIEDPMGRQPETKRIFIPAAYYERAKEQAAIANTSPQAFINSLLENYLGGNDDGLRTTGKDSSPCETEWLCSDPQESIARDSSGDLPYANSGPILSDNPNEERQGTGNGNPPTDTQESQPQEPDPVTDFKAIALEERIANIVKRDIKTSFHKPEKRNFLKDAPWGKLASEIGEDPKIVFDDFKQYLIDVATAKPHPNPEAWAATVANSLFNNEGSEVNCIPWVKFSDSYKTGQAIELPQQTQVDPMEEWFSLVKELRMFPQVCRKRNAVKDCSEWVPYDQISKRYTLEYLRKQVNKS